MRTAESGPEFQSLLYGDLHREIIVIMQTKLSLLRDQPDWVTYLYVFVFTLKSLSSLQLNRSVVSDSL